MQVVLFLSANRHVGAGRVRKKCMATVSRVEEPSALLVSVFKTTGCRKPFDPNSHPHGRVADFDLGTQQNME